MYLIEREFFVLDLKTAPAIWDYAEELTVLGGIQVACVGWPVSGG